MLKEAATDSGKDWDRIISYLLFAYREVPQTSTGFSPFELLYSQHHWTSCGSPGKQGRKALRVLSLKY